MFNYRGLLVDEVEIMEIGKEKNKLFDVHVRQICSRKERMKNNNKVSSCQLSAWLAHRFRDRVT
jgi:hypothetical protein